MLSMYHGMTPQIFFAAFFNTVFQVCYLGPRIPTRFAELRENALRKKAGLKVTECLLAIEVPEWRLLRLLGAFRGFEVAEWRLI